MSTIKRKEKDPLNMTPALNGMIVIALIAPASLLILWRKIWDIRSDWQIYAMTWVVSFRSYELIGFIIDPMILFIDMLLFFLRGIFVNQMFRYYKMKTTKKRTLLLGIASELQCSSFSIVLAIIQIIMVPGEWGFHIPFFIPIPILFLAGYTILKLRPLEEVTTPWKESEVITAD